eukprot:7226751-Heterocapsa_arctica.AAC.1
MAMPAIMQPFSQPPTLVPASKRPERELEWKAAPVAKAKLSPVMDHRPDMSHTAYAHSRPGRVGVHTPGVAVAVQPGLTPPPSRP